MPIQVAFGINHNRFVIHVYQLQHLDVVEQCFMDLGFGYILQDLSGNRKLLPLYLYGGFFGALVYLLSANTLPYLQTTVTNGGFMIGGGAAVMAIAVATTTLAPDYRIFPLISGEFLCGY
jgi:hypothetical protein